MQEEDLTNIRVAPGYKVHIPVKVSICKNINIGHHVFLRNFDKYENR